MKVCKTCKEEKALSEYRNYKRSPDGKEYSCKVYRRRQDKKYYTENEERREAMAARRDRKRLENRKFVLDYLKANPCTDCDETDVIVLEFDHLRDKKHNIARMMTYSRKEIEKEIAKCDVVCANCHRRRTARRAGNWYSNIRE